MVKSGEIVVEVQPLRVWDKAHVLLGYHAGLFGPNNRGDTRTYIKPALHCNGTLAEPKLHPTPEEAMAAWEQGAPKILSSDHAKLHGITFKTVDEINERGLYREAKA